MGRQVPEAQAGPVPVGPDDCALQGPVFSTSQTRETPAEADALIPRQGMLRFINRPHGEETLSKMSAAAFF